VLDFAFDLFAGESAFFLISGSFESWNELNFPEKMLALFEFDLTLIFSSKEMYFKFRYSFVVVQI
jgi:hypothetical protein